MDHRTVSKKTPPRARHKAHAAEARAAEARAAPAVSSGFRGAVRLAGELLQFDGFTEDGLTFVSHAHVPVPPDAERLVTSVITARLLGSRARYALATPYGREFSLGALELRMLPTGHVPGAAALLVRHQRRTLIYAGHLGAYGEFFGLAGAVAKPCDTLVLHAPYGGPGPKLPKPHTVLKRIGTFCRKAHADGLTPVLLCARLGLAQPLSALLHKKGFAVQLHRSQHRYLGPLRELGLPVGPARRFAGDLPSNGVLLWPLDLREAASLDAALPHRCALVSARALVPHAADDYGCHAAFPLSEHADHPRILDYVSRAAPRRIYLLPGTPPDLAAALQSEGREVHRFGPPAQLELFTT
jgi:putative mRNA 3-end processing factor